MINTLVSTLNTTAAQAGIMAENSPALDTLLEGLWPSLVVVLGTLITMAILTVVCSHFLYFPIKEYVEKRREHIKSNIDNAEQMTIDASNALNHAEQNLIDSKEEAFKIIENSSQQATIVGNEIILKAKDKVEQMMTDARNNIKEEEAASEAEMNQQLVEVAMLAASKILEEEVDSKKNQQLVESFIKDISGGK